MSYRVRDSNDAFILGLDGVPWELVREWAVEGALPHVSRVIDEGAGGPLQSTTPASTPLAWPSITTGTWPDRHGIYSFQRVAPDYTHELCTSDDVRGVKLWDVLSPAVVANVPITYPANEIDGTMVAGMLAPQLNERSTHPPTLAGEIRRTYPDYEVGLNWDEYAGRSDELADDIASLLEARRALMRRLMETEAWRLFFFTYTEPDRLQHLAWEEATLLEHYRHLDDILGDVLDYAERHDVTVYVVSDHGFGSLTKKVAANVVLESEGYLTRRRGGGGQSVLETLGLTKENVSRFAAMIGVDEDDFVRKYVPKSIADYAAATVPGDHFLYDLEHAETEAFVHEHGNVYVNDAERFADGPVAPGDVESVKRSLQSTFASVTDPETGTRMLDVHDGAELFPRDPRSPDLVLEPRTEYGVSFSLAADPVFDPLARADHRSDGIFLAWGPAVEAGVQPEEATVVDVAPTVLHGSGKPVPERADGRVLEEIFAPDSEPASRNVETRRYRSNGGDLDVDDDFEDVKNRLRGLGYVE